MIHPLVKIMVVDGFFNQNDAQRLCNIAANLKYESFEFGDQIPHFNMIPENANEMFSSILNTKIEVDEDNSGVFRKPVTWIHFEGFDDTNEWIFVCALTETTVNIFEHQSGATTALDEHNFNYRNLFEWDLQIDFVLKPGQGMLFRPWLFHSFNGGLVQLFKLREKE